MSESPFNLAPAATPGANSQGTPPAGDEPALVQRCRLGDGPALTVLIQRYQDRLFNALLRLCGNSHDAEELCQDTFVRFLAKIGEFRGGSGLYTWLFRIAMNLALSHRRRAGKVRLAPLEARAGQEEDLAHTLPDLRQATPDEQVERAQEHQRVLEALEGLEQEFRAVVVLRDVEGMDYEQIAQVLNVPVGTVRSRLFRARHKLADQLKDLARTE
jgi:RNA polymerase sigma-70 factor (ECF subfamily)